MYCKIHPREIALARLQPAPETNYPKGLLAIENEGYGGHLKHPARANHRIIPLTLGGQDWSFQYSPYLYYNEHSILLSNEVRDMVIDRGAFEHLLDFVSQFPHYFAGSNADLPIVGGSILTHDYYQAGRSRSSGSAPARKSSSSCRRTSCSGIGSSMKTVTSSRLQGKCAITR